MTLNNYNFNGFTINLYIDEQGDWLAHLQEIPALASLLWRINTKVPV